MAVDSETVKPEDDLRGFLQDLEHEATDNQIT